MSTGSVDITLHYLLYMITSGFSSDNDNKINLPRCSIDLDKRFKNNMTNYESQCALSWMEYN